LVLLRLRRELGHVDHYATIAAVQWAERRETSGTRPRYRFHARQQFLPEDVQLRPLIVSSPQIYAHHQHALGPEARVKLFQILKTGEKQAGADEQEERERDLRHDEQFAEPQTRTAV